ncbi:AraC family transcriptional regulator [Rheinheimera mesophila]|uniref:AraC family transcriptional regulator n=1 Tax=Rheinheimera mesophila TaxID=1547515 RepID=A0A3P3QEQ5_9GAMM|nr:AraC family transcriptional regulator [Rheinheimera mesophila]KKL00634.1 AraC family transcriptional regulator [Rheinheimera mesophila]RRJ19692.1 AraC family transcriptional regulator [Rheinheimera mesophila]
MDRLSTLLAQFGMHATTIYGGALGGEMGFDAMDRTAKLHLLRSGDVVFQMEQQKLLVITEPSLLFIPRPCCHSLSPAAGRQSAQHPQLVSAALKFDGGLDNPLTTALPAYVLMPLADVSMLSGNLDWLFDEAFAQHCGKNAVLNRLFELVVIQLLRYMMANRSVSTGMMAGLADLRLAKAVTLMHDQPARAWSVAELASAASMSRASFAAKFHKVVGITPADYLVSWRVSLTQKLLREGRPIALIADEVGYESPSALARTFRRKTGSSPREWLQLQQ